MRSFAALMGIAFALSLAAPAAARPFRVNDIPNGTKNTCLNCHVDLKASAQTDFGSDAQTKLIGPNPVSNKHVDWAPLCPLDSDHDGYTNGFELGDPDCKWVVGDPNPSGPVYLPGDPDSHPPPICGDGKLNAGEECEGDMLSETDCAVMGAGEGTLACTSECSFDYSACSMPPGGGPPVGGPGPAAEDDGCSAAHPAGSSSGPAALIFALAVAAGMRRPRRAQRRGIGLPSSSPKGQ